MVITRADNLSSSEPHPVDPVEAAKTKITVIPPRNGSSMAPNLFSSITCSNDQVHCYFPFSKDLSFSIAEMIKKVKEERPNKRIHHIEVTLSLFNTGILQTANRTNGEADDTCPSIARNTNFSSGSRSESLADDDDDDDQWTDISSDEMETELVEGMQPPNAPSLSPGQVNIVTNVPTEVASPIKKPEGKPHYAQSSGSKVICNECGKRFKNPSLLSGHMVKHSTERPWKCVTCGNAYKSRGTLKNHQRLVHSKDSFTHSCEKCGKKFAFRSHLSKHMLTHLKNGVKNAL